MEFNEKNIGIIGYWFATNYGGVASYYSLYKTIRELGFSPFLVENPYLNTDKEGADVFSRNFFKEINAPITECYPMDKLDELNGLADTFILGSDQVFTTSSIKGFGKLFLMEFADETKKRFAFSASCGGDNLKADSALLSYAQKQLSRFTAVSVREYSAVKIVAEQLGINAEFMIDPIFLTGAEAYKDAAKTVEIPEDNYMLSYILDPTPDKRVGIYEISSQLELRKKVILDGRKFTHQKNAELLKMPNVTLPELNFKEWLAYFSKSSFVFTDSFHGAAMAIIMNKPFIMYANYQRGYPRFLTLAEMFDIKSRLIDKSSDITYDLLRENINFKNLNSVIAENKGKAVGWLINALNAPNSPASEKTALAEHTAEKNISGDTPYYKIDSYKSKENEDFFVCKKSLCTGCAACANKCPKNCIKMIADNEGFVYPQIDKNLCVDCKLCEKVCPVLMREKNNEKKPLEVYAGFSLDNNVRYMSTSGGAFTEFAKYALKMSGVCYGAAYDDDFNVNHIRIANENEIPAIRQSKYLQSNINDIFKRVKEDLERGLYVLFCGAPCQCAGLKSFLNREYKRLIVIDFICHSICSPKAFQYYLKDVEKQFSSKASQVWFKNKETTWKNFSLRIDFKDKKEYYLQTCKKDAYFEAFLKYRVCSRPSCHNCQFKGTDRFSDVTLADYWGLKWNNPDFGEEQTKDGVSLIILNTKKGKEIFDNYTKHRMYTEQHSLEDAIRGNGGYSNSQKPGLYRDYFFENLEIRPFSEIIQAMRLREEEIHQNKG